MSAQQRRRQGGQVTKDVPPPATAPNQSSTNFVGEVDIMEGINEGVMDMARRQGVPHADAEMNQPLLTPMQMATPRERPGFRQQWVLILDEDDNPDPANKALYFTSGFTPRCPSTLLPGEAAPVYRASGFEHGVIMFNGRHLLCEIRAEEYDRAMARIKYRVDRLYKNIQPTAATNSRTMSINPVDASEVMD